MRKLLVVAVLGLAVSACGSDVSDPPLVEYDLSPPAAEVGARCQPFPTHCPGSDGTMRVCYFACPDGVPEASSGCTPSNAGGCTPDAAAAALGPFTNRCVFACPMAP